MSTSNMTSFRFKTAIVFLLASLKLYQARHNYQMGQDRNRRGSSSSSVCLTPGCKKAAGTILINLDETVDPCDDFYQFGCGGYMSRVTIPEHRTEKDVTTDIADELNLKLKDLLEKNLDTPQPSFIKMAKDFYFSCMDLDNIERMNSQPLGTSLGHLGGWPVVEGSRWNESEFDWVDSLISMKRIGYDHNLLFRMQVDVDPRNNSRRLILLDQVPLEMPDRSYYLEGLSDSVKGAYFKKMVQSAKLLYAEESIAKKELLEALQFETSLARITKPAEERIDQSKLYNKYTVSDLQKLAPVVPWLKYFNGLLNDEIFETDIVIVTDPLFIRRVAGLISFTEKRVLANYMMWRVVSQSMNYLSREWKDVVQEYSMALSGESEESSRWEQCVGVTMKVLGVSLSSYYVKNYFKEEDKEAVSTILRYVHKEFLQILDDIDWMDGITKKEAKAKATAIVPYIGYPTELLNVTAVSYYLRKINITRESYFDNVRMYYKWFTDERFSKLRKPVIKREWDKYAKAAVVNAFYHFEENTMHFPAGILQDAFFERDRPNYLNFGGIGWVIGHEITHGFDDMGKQFDKDGNERNWWEMSTDQQFALKAQCIVDQYSNYTAENGMKLNGLLTQGENIADIGGLKEAYRAYQSWTKDNGVEKLLPGVNYTQNQLFWINAAYQWCSKYRPEKLKLYIVSDNHSPAPFRVIGSVSNLADFSKDFNCPPDSRMNNRNKCEVW